MLIVIFSDIGLDKPIRYTASDCGVAVFPHLIGQKRDAPEALFFDRIRKIRYIYFGDRAYDIKTFKWS